MGQCFSRLQQITFQEHAVFHQFVRQETHFLKFVSHHLGQVHSSLQAGSNAPGTTPSSASAKVVCESWATYTTGASPQQCGAQQAGSTIREQPDILQPTRQASSSHSHASGITTQLHATTTTTAAPRLLSRGAGGFDPVAAAIELERRYRENLLMAQDSDQAPAEEEASPHPGN